MAGWLAGVVMKGGGYGLIGDIIVGLVGAFVGGIVFSLITGGGSAGFWGSIAVAFVGAVIAIAVVRALSGPLASLTVSTARSLARSMGYTYAVIVIRLTCSLFWVDVRLREINGRWIASADTPNGPSLGLGEEALDAIAGALEPFSSIADELMSSLPVWELGKS